MTPYATYSYFGFLLCTALPAIGLGLRGRLNRWAIFVLSLVMLGMQYGLLLDVGSSGALPFWELLGYGLYETGLAFALLRAKQRGASAWTFRAAVGLSLLPLAVVKVVGLAWPGYAIGFLGISYLTFRSLDLIFSIQDGLVREIEWRDLLLYLFFFPTAASGPVDRYRRFRKDLEQVRTPEQYGQDMRDGIHRIMLGFLYKFILAYVIKQYWMDRSVAPTLLATLSYMYAYSFYLFFDFAGYSHFAIGVSYLFGIRTPENFDRPFLARNIRDFWNRWHISLSFWFRDHVYMRFVMWATRRKLLADKHRIGHLGFLLSMGLMGVWHGLQPHYIVYGLYHAGLLIAYDAFSRWNRQHPILREGPLSHGLSILATFQVVCFGLLIFSGKLF